MTSTQLKALVHATLTGRPAGQEILDTEHEILENAIIDYIDANSSTTRSAHASATANTNCDLVWSMAFLNTNYAYSISAFDSSGDPVEVVLVTKAQNKLTVQTLIAATLTAISIPY